MIIVDIHDSNFSTISLQVILFIFEITENYYIIRLGVGIIKYDLNSRHSQCNIIAFYGSFCVKVSIRVLSLVPSGKEAEVVEVHPRNMFIPQEGWTFLAAGIFRQKTK